MSDNHDTQILDLQRELAEAKTENESLRDKVTAEKEAEFRSKIEALEASLVDHVQEVAEKEKENKVLAESLKSQEEAFASRNEEAKSAEDELAVMKKQEALMQRKAKLEDLGFNSDEAIATIEELDSVDEETFDKIVAVMKKKAGMPPWMKKDKDKDKDKEEEKESPAKADEEVDIAEANVEVLEDVEESAEVAIAEAIHEDDPAESLRAVASEWLGSILQSVPKENN
jgi:hypothetical protein